MIKRVSFSTLAFGLLIIIGTIFQNPAMWKTGGTYDFGIGYWGPLARDGAWHEALVAAIDQNIVPNNPSLSGVKLTNYHYFYDALVSITHKVTGIDSRLLIYRFFPVVFSLLLGIGTYLLTRRIAKSKFVSFVTLYLVYFGSSFGWVIDVLRSREIGGESAFWANQPVSLNINPPFAISLVLVVFILLFLDIYLAKPKKGIAALIIILSGILIGFKVYAGVIVLGGLLVLGLKKAIFDKNFKVLPIFGLAFIISAVIFFLTSSGAVGFIAIQPLWLIDTMIDAGDRVGIPNFTSRRFTYIGAGKWVHLVLLEFLCILLFIVGNLGTRIISFVSGGWRYFTNDLQFTILAMVGISFFPTLLFVQKGNPWNIVQFLYYFLFFSALLAGVGMNNLLRFVPKKAFKVFFVLFVVLTPISSIATFRSWLYPNPPAYISTDEIAGLKFLKDSNKGVVFVHPFDPELRGKYRDPYPIFVYTHTAYVSAHSGQEVFLEDVEQQIVLNTDYKGRLADAQRFFKEKDLSWSNNFLRENNISYVYLPKVFYLPEAEQKYQMTKVFENKEVNIYKIN